MHVMQGFALTFMLAGCGGGGSDAAITAPSAGSSLASTPSTSVTLPEFAINGGSSDPLAAQHASSLNTTTISDARKLQSAINDAPVGAVIKLASGTYIGPFNVNGVHGREGSPITIEASGMGDAVIKGDAVFIF